MNDSHHAILVRENAVRLADLSGFTADFEVVDQYIERFGIDDARALVKKAYNRPAENTQLLLIIRTDFITHESQNALLKLLEEPPLSTKFIFVLPLDFVLLKTLQSRLSKEVNPNKKKEGQTEEFQIFLKSSYAERISSIEKATKKKDLLWQRAVKQGLITYVNNASDARNSLKEIEYVARVLLTRGASNKMLFEHLALTLDIRS